MVGKFEIFFFLSVLWVSNDNNITGHAAVFFPCGCVTFLLLFLQEYFKQSVTTRCSPLLCDIITICYKCNCSGCCIGAYCVTMAQWVQKKKVLGQSLCCDDFPGVLTVLYLFRASADLMKSLFLHRKKETNISASWYPLATDQTELTRAVPDSKINFWPCKSFDM